MIGEAKFRILLLAALLAPSFSSAEVKALPQNVRDHLFDNASSVQLLYSTKDLPAAVIDACAAIVSGHEFRLANPREKFQAADVVIEANLPRRRLIWAAKIPGFYLLHYELGGRGLSRHALLVTYSDDKGEAQVIWTAAFFLRLNDYQEFLAALAADLLDDDKKYSH